MTRPRVVRGLTQRRVLPGLLYYRRTGTSFVGEHVGGIAERTGGHLIKPFLRQANPEIAPRTSAIRVRLAPSTFLAPCSHFAIEEAYTALREPASGGGHFDERRANCGWFRDPLACLSEAVGRLGRARRSPASARRDPATRISRFALRGTAR
jgi:hypothetical protein